MKYIKFLAIICVVALLSSCGAVQLPVAQENKIVAPKFTTIDKVVKLKVGMSFDEVVSTLGSLPYDVYTINFDEKKSVFVWYYKKLERKVPPSILDTRDGAVSGEEVLTKQDMLYCVFNENNILVKAYTDSGDSRYKIVEPTINQPQQALNQPGQQTTNQPQPQPQKPIWKFWGK